MNAGICPGATRHFAHTSNAFDAERNRQKCDDPKCSFIQTLLRASASPEHKLTAAEQRQIQRRHEGKTPL
jgi:hypothetical protein